MKDLPLPASPPSTEAWLRTATVLQPYAHSQYVALLNAGDRPEKLKRDFGFNVIVVLPTDAHNSQTPAAEHLTDGQFRAGLDAYRKAGFKIVLYTSVMANGLSQEFQSGQIAHEHPDWEQRDPKGNPIMVYGLPWLCPSTGARAAALDRAVRLVQDYHPDGILLDNNQFYFAAAGWTCHCDACTAAFRDYVKQRCGDEGSQKLFGATPEKLQIPAQEGPLFSLWMQWRNRVWANIDETFRARLREIDPHIILLANTQYLFKDGVLATDLQYEREDTVVSESVGLSSPGMSDKMVLGQAIAQGRPLLNYIGTFTNGEEYTGLRPATVIGPLIAATIAHGARPWIVDGFDLGGTDAAARQEMSRLLAWQAAHEELYQAKPWARVAAVISLTSRNVRHQPLIPPNVSALRDAGVPVAGLRDDEITLDAVRPFKVLTVETAECLSEEATEALGKWVRDGGTLIAAEDTGTYDSLGRKREAPLLSWAAVEGAGTLNVGKGRVIVPKAKEFAAACVKESEQYGFGLPAKSGVEVVPYQNGDTVVLHIVRHPAGREPITLRLPSEVRVGSGDADWLIPGEDRPTTVKIDSKGGEASITLSRVPVYSVVKIVALR